MSETIKYDPNQHDGCLFVADKFIIIQDATLAKLHELPLEARVLFAKETALQIAMHDFASGVGQAILQNADSEYTQALVQGYLKGIELLQIPSDSEPNHEE